MNKKCIQKRFILHVTVLAVSGVIVLGGSIYYLSHIDRFKETQFPHTDRTTQEHPEELDREIAQKALHDNETINFRVISYKYVADDKQVLFRGQQNNYIHVNGIDPKTARIGDLREKGVEYIESAYWRSDVVVDDNHVFVGTEPLVANHDFHFLNWRTGSQTYATIYGRSGDAIICLSVDDDNMVVGNVLATDAASFVPILISGRDRYYAKDDAGNAFVNCVELQKVANEPIQNFETKALFWGNQVTQLLLLSDTAVYNRDGVLLVERTDKNQSFRYLDEVGNYFTIDGKVYWVSGSAKQLDTKVYMLNNGDVDLPTFEVLDSGGLAKDKHRVYVKKEFRTHYINDRWDFVPPEEVVFVPRDITTFTGMDCHEGLFFKDALSVYTQDGLIFPNADPATFADDPRCTIRF
jgi:hypothetical protein